MKRISPFVLFVFISFSFLFAQKQSTPDLKALIPIDPAVKMGKLDNGLTYLIKKNKKPENRASIRLGVNAGAILEDDDQNGLAHFIEHMAFNGTKNFKKNELVSYLETVGTRFGQDLNAGTGQDQTIYMLQVRTDDENIFEKAFIVFSDWAHYQLLEPEEIEKERGVILEEWRLGRGADARMEDKQSPIVYKGSKYAVRNVIGDKEVILKANREAFQRFYNDWYRPDLMEFVVIGDFDVEKVEKWIVKYFSGIPKPVNPKERKEFEVPDHKETLFAIASDKEATSTNISVIYKRPAEVQKTIGDFRQSLVTNIFNSMNNKRFSELTQQADPPFLYAYSYKGNITRSKGAYQYMASVKDNGIEKGLKTILVEAERVRKFGFTQTEFDRTKNEILRSAEKRFSEKDKLESDQIINTYVYDFLAGSRTPTVEDYYKYAKELLPTITLAEVNELAGKYITDENRVIAVSMPEKEGVKVPTEKDLLAVFEDAKKIAVTPYQDNVSTEPLIAAEPKAGKIVDEKYFAETGITQLKLSNGATVVLKPTDFKNDEIIFKAFSFGGSSLLGENNFYSANAAASVISNSGVGSFNRIALTKKLSGKVANVSPYIGAYEEGLNGSGSPKDVETMFQLIYSYFTQPRKDSTGFMAYKAQMKAMLENRNAAPTAALIDTLSLVMNNRHYAGRPMTLDLLNKLDLNKSYEFYKNRFADASDFTFVFTGSFTKESIQPLIEKYVASLPSISRKETWSSMGFTLAKGVIKKDVIKGLEPQSQVYIIFTGDFDFNAENNYYIKTLSEVLNIKLREAVREDKGGTYGISCGGMGTDKPFPFYQLYVTFGCAPERVDELINTVFATIEKVKKDGPEAADIAKVKETQIRSREVDLKKNQTWLSEIYSALIYGRDFKSIIDYSNFTNNIDEKKIQEACNKYFNMNNYIKAVLLPEKK